MNLQRCGKLLVFGIVVSAWTTTVRAADEGTAGQTQEVLMKLHQSNQMEIAAGKMAQDKGQSKDVKSFGKTLVTDHTAADKKVMALAKQEKINLPGNEPMPQDNMDKIHSASGSDFDKMFAAEMLDDHKKAIADVQSARESTSDAKLKTLLSQLQPVLEKHRDIAQKLNDKYGPSASAASTNAAPADSK